MCVLIVKIGSVLRRPLAEPPRREELEFPRIMRDEELAQDEREFIHRLREERKERDKEFLGLSVGGSIRARRAAIFKKCQ